MRAALTIIVIACCMAAQAQESTPVTEQQLENQAEIAEGENEDDAYWQQLESLRRHPLHLNTVTPGELEALPMLNALQVASFFRYRNLLGKLVSLHELQAIPRWDLTIIRQLLPFVTLGPEPEKALPLARRWEGGSHSLLVRLSQVLERSKGFQAPVPAEKNHYQGSPQRLFARYRYQHNSGLQYGVTADKDAGESFFRGTQKAGFDFYSFHLFARKMGAIKALALGDFTVNMGQGLTHWQSLAFKKSAGVMQVKRQGPVLKPYSAAGEYQFHRGAGITVQLKHWETTVFASIRKLDANLANDSITSLSTMGYHRTEAELQDRQNLQRITAGGTVRYARARWQVGANTVWYRFSHPFTASGDPYDRYAMTGHSWSNHSVDYSATHRNLHFYGELAIDERQHTALVHGLLMSLDPKADISLVYRRLDKAYQAPLGNAFTESFLPGNESGLYAGLNLRPATQWQVDAYVDCFRFPWLKHRIHAPGHGADYLLQLLYKPNKQVEWLSRYRHEHKPINLTTEEWPVHPVVRAVRQNWRSQVMWQATPVLTVKSRVELVWYRREGVANVEKGFSAFTEVFYAPARSGAANMRLQFFETDSYNARIYAYEQDVQYHFSIPVFSGKGLRYYLNYKQHLAALLSRKRARKFDCILWLRWAQFVFPGKIVTGSGLDELDSKTKTEFRVQLMFQTR